MSLKRSIKTALEIPLHMTASWRKLPDFILIGAQKSGTTSLFSYLTEHPEDLRNPLNYKEVYFFNSRYEKGVNHYKHYFPLKYRHGLVGEATTTYLHSKEAPARVSSLLPAVKLILILRDPVSRAISHYYHHKKRGRESRSLEEAFSQDILNSFDSGNFADDGFSYRYLNNGDYQPHIANWEKYYPSSQICVSSAEEMFKNPQNVYSRVCDFLGIDSMFSPVFRVQNQGSEKSELEEVELRLRAFYAPRVARLYESKLISFRWQDL